MPKLHPQQFNKTRRAVVCDDPLCDGCGLPTERAVLVWVLVPERVCPGCAEAHQQVTVTRLGQAELQRLQLADVASPGAAVPAADLQPKGGAS